MNVYLVSKTELYVCKMYVFVVRLYVEIVEPAFKPRETEAHVSNEQKCSFMSVQDLLED